MLPTSSEIAAIVSELETFLAGSVVEKVLQRDDHTVVLTLKLHRRVRGEKQPLKKLFLLLSADPDLPRLHVVPERGKERSPPGPFGQWLRARVRGAWVQGIQRPEPGRVVEIALEVSGGPSRESGKRERLILVAELAGRPPNLVLLTGLRRVLGSLNPVRQKRDGKWEEVEAGEEYPRRRGEPGPRERVKDPPAPIEGSPPDDPLARLFPFNRSLGRHWDQLLVEQRFKMRLEKLSRQLSAALVKRKNLGAGLDRDLSRAREGGAGLRMGELLKAELPRLRRGMKNVEVVDYYSSELSRVVIPLDPALDPGQNIEKFFQRHRKSRRAIPIILERIARVGRETTLLQELTLQVEKLVDSGVGGEEKLRLIEEQARPVLPSSARRGQGSKGMPKGSSSGKAGPRQFVSRDGWTILLGRSQDLNDQLTFRIARGNDLFLHLSGRPGPHVVVRVPRGKTVPPETLLDAAQLALYYSLPRHTGRQTGQVVAAEVDYIEVKHVRKPAGARPGAVLLSRHRTVRVGLEKDRIDRLLGKTGSPGQLPGDDPTLTAPGKV